MYRPQWPQQAQLVDPHATSHMVPDYHAQVVAQAVAQAITQVVAVLVHDDIPIAEFVHHGSIGRQQELPVEDNLPNLSVDAIPSADDISMADFITSLTQSDRDECLERCGSYDSISSGSSCSTPTSTNASDSEDSSHKGSSRSRAGVQLSAAKTERTKKDRKPLTDYQKAILQKYKDSKKLVIDGVTYQGEYVPKGPELEDLMRDTRLTKSQVRGSLQTASTLPGLD